MTMQGEATPDTDVQEWQGLVSCNGKTASIRVKVNETKPIEVITLKEDKDLPGSKQSLSSQSTSSRSLEQAREIKKPGKTDDDSTENTVISNKTEESPPEEEGSCKLQLEEWQSLTQIKAFRHHLETKETSLEKEGLASILKPDDDTVRRYLRARKGDIDGAVDQYVNAERFFQQRGCATMLSTPDPHEFIYAATCPHLNHGYDKEGRPIYIERTGKIDSAALLQILTPYDIVHRHVRQQQVALERIKASSLENKRLVENQVIILDLKGLNMRPNKQALACFKACTDMDQAYYPERLHRLYIINAPFIFRPLWAMVKFWLDPATKDKFRVLGSKYQSVLLEDISPNQLPVEQGGTIQDLWPTPVPLTPAQRKAAVQRVRRAQKNDKLWEPTPPLTDPHSNLSLKQQSTVDTYVDAEAEVCM